MSKITPLVLAVLGLLSAACGTADPADTRENAPYAADAASAGRPKPNAATIARILAELRAKLPGMTARVRANAEREIARLTGTWIPPVVHTGMWRGKSIRYTVSHGVALMGGDVPIAQVDSQGRLQLPATSYIATLGVDVDIVDGHGDSQPAWKWYDREPAGESWQRTGCTIPYIRDPSVDDGQWENFLTATQEITHNTNCYFRPKRAGEYALRILTAQDEDGKRGEAQMGRVCQWVAWDSKELTCRPNLRNGSTTESALMTSDGSVETYLHELQHVLGIWHEHERPDRGSYVEARDYVPQFIFDEHHTQPQGWPEWRKGYDIRSASHYDGQCYWLPIFGPFCGMWKCFGDVFPPLEYKAECWPDDYYAEVGLTQRLTTLDIVAINGVYHDWWF